MQHRLHTNRFHLVRYFTLTSVGMFILVAGLLGFFVQQQSDFFTQVQDGQINFFGQVQDAFAKQQQQVARRDLISIHESGNINLTRLFANALWESDFAPFVAQASQIPVEQCRAIPDQEINGKMAAPAEKKACFKEVGEIIMAIPGFNGLDAKVFGSMKKSTVYKIKVFDTRAITVYSSQHSQIGDDKINNAGWQSASKGVPASELSHRDSFSAFEGVVEDRDVISSYQPVYKPGTDEIVGVFEVYSDVTQFLDRINQTEHEIRQSAQLNQSKVEAEAATNQKEVDASSTWILIVITALLLILFVGLFIIVRRADTILLEQEEERQETQTQLSQAEKMASLGQMVAGVAHQLNTPLAFSHSNLTMVKASLPPYRVAEQMLHRLTAFLRKSSTGRLTLDLNNSKKSLLESDEEMAEVAMFDEMLGDTLKGIEQMQEMVENLRDFTRLDRAKVSNFDINKGLKNVVYIAKSVIPTTIDVVEVYNGRLEMVCNPSQLNQIFLNLINNAAQSIDGEGRITITSAQQGDNIIVSINDNGRGISDDVLPNIFEMYYTTKSAGEGTGMGLAIARTIANEHGGDIKVETRQGEGSTFRVILPVAGLSQEREE